MQSNYPNCIPCQFTDCRMTKNRNVPLDTQYIILFKQKLTHAYFVNCLYIILRFVYCTGQKFCILVSGFLIKITLKRLIDKFQPNQRPENGVGLEFKHNGKCKVGLISEKMSSNNNLIKYN